MILFSVKLALCIKLFQFICFSSIGDFFTLDLNSDYYFASCTSKRKFERNFFYLFQIENFIKTFEMDISHLFFLFCLSFNFVFRITFCAVGFLIGVYFPVSSGLNKFFYRRISSHNLAVFVIPRISRIPHCINVE